RSQHSKSSKPVLHQDLCRCRKGRLRASRFYKRYTTFPPIVFTSILYINYCRSIVSHKKETPSNTSSASRLRRRWRRGERIRERPHRLHLHLQRRHVVDRFLQKGPSRQRPAPRHQSPKHPQPAPHPLPRFRGPRPPAAAADLAAGPEEEARPAAGAEEDGAAPPGPAAGGEREGGVRGLLDGARPEFGSGAEGLEEASAVYPLLRRGPPLGPRLGFWATLHPLLPRTRGR
ncbi:unnamed protein product, partial [Musa hybrid cultivar]